MNWTFDQGTMITDETLAALDAARNEITTAQPQAADLLDKAERLVFHGHVMVVENETFVYDQSWARVYPSRCPHCFLSPDLCEHKLAAWLARHLAEADPDACTDEPPAAFNQDGAGASTGGSYLGGIGPGYHGGRRTYSRSGGKRKRTCQDCSHCHWHQDGHCTNPNKKAGRNIR